ncbi:MAG: hypothetical protein ACREQV_08505 [Candidatus Binatia bacterium]
MRFLSFCLFLLLLVPQAQASERFLVPIYLPGAIPGAFGSQWVSELQILNTGDSQAVIENYGPGCTFPPCAPALLPPGISIPGTSVRDLVVNGIPGALLFVESQFADQLVFQLRARDISRSTESWGTWFPVVHESAAGETIHLLDIPVKPQFRTMLRVYSFADTVGQSARVRVFGTDPELLFPYPMTPDPLLAEFVLPLRTGTSAQPAYAEYFDLTEFADDGDWSAVRVEVTAETSLPIWAMVTITNNETQEVTAVMPR